MKNHNYENNKKITIQTGVHYRILEQRYMKEKKEIEKNNMAHHPSWMINNIK